MKKIFLLLFSILLASASYSQSMKEKLAAKMSGGGGGGGGEAKAVEPPDGDYSDPTGISGTYYPTSTMPYGDGKKVIKVLKLEIVDGTKAIMHAMKGEDDPSELYMEGFMKYARDNFKLTQFRTDNYSIFTVEPGVLVFGATMWAPEGYPGKNSHTLIADTAKIPPVILVKDEAMISKYSYADAKRIFSEQATLGEIANTLRLAENTPLPTIGKMTADKVLIENAVELMKAKWAESKEPTTFRGCYIYNDDWANVVYGKGYVGSTTLSDEVTAIMLFEEPASGLCYYYGIGISRETRQLNASGQWNDDKRGLFFTGNSTIQYITKAKLEEGLAAIK